METKKNPHRVPILSLHDMSLSLRNEGHMVGLVIFTHGSVGAALQECAVDFFQEDQQLVSITLDKDADRATSWAALIEAVAQADSNEGVLVLVDMFGGTPSNLAMALLTREDVAVITGVNLPMVLRAMQKRAHLPVHKLATEVLAYGRRNVTSAAEWLKPERTEEVPAGVEG
jgi:PTS system mannose-specific IIA component